MIYLFINGIFITVLLHIIQPLNWGFDELQWNCQVMWAEKGTLWNEWEYESTDKNISSTAYCLFRICTRTKMNAPQPVIITSPIVQGQQVQQGMTSQPQVVVMQAPSSPQLEMEKFLAKFCRWYGSHATDHWHPHIPRSNQCLYHIHVPYDLLCTGHVGWNICEYLYHVIKRHLVVDMPTIFQDIRVGIFIS